MIKKPKIYVICCKARAKDQTAAFAFYTGEVNGLPAFSFDATKAVTYTSKRDALKAGIKNALIIKVPLKRKE